MLIFKIGEIVERRELGFGQLGNKVIFFIYVKVNKYFYIYFYICRYNMYNRYYI